MAARGDTRLLGLRGLYVEAQRRNDPAAARQFAEQAAKDAPALAWAGQAVLEFRCAAGDWEGALGVLEEHRKSGMLDRLAHRRQRAVLLTARALAAEESDRDTARTLSLEAAKLAPELVPAAALAGRLLAESGERRKAAKIVEAAWKANPHPDLADAHAHVRLSDSARDRLTRMQALARMAPGHIESALAVARAALDAREFAVARAALSSLLAEPTQRVAQLMAELEHLEGDEGRAREWMSRALHAALDPAWTADGIVSDRWLPVSPVTGRLDAFQWKVPVAELGERAAVLIEAPAEPERRAELPRQDLPRQDLPREVVSPPLGNVGAENGGRSARTAPARPAASPAPIIPLTQVPDDPGPEPEADADVDMETEPKPDAWQRIRQLFR
jgi:HemY protein